MITDLSANVNTKGINGLLNILGSLPGNPGFKPVMDRIGQRVKSRIQLGFRNSTDPWGNEWIGIIHREGKPLVDTGRLRSSITYFADSEQVEIGTNVEYAAVHQFGGKVNARPFMPIDPDGNAKLPDNWEKSVLNAINQHLKKATSHAH